MVIFNSYVSHYQRVGHSESWVLSQADSAICGCASRPASGDLPRQGHHRQGDAAGLVSALPEGTGTSLWQEPQDSGTIEEYII